MWPTGDIAYVFGRSDRNIHRIQEQTDSDSFITCCHSRTSALEESRLVAYQVGSCVASFQGSSKNVPLNDQIYGPAAGRK